MNRSFFVKLCAVLLVAMVSATPPAYGCSQCCRVCSPTCPQIFYDNYFSEQCAWVYGGGTQHVVVSGNGMGELYGIGSIYQAVTPTTNNDLQFDLVVVPGSDPGTNRIVVEVLSGSGTLLETLDTITEAGTYNYDVGNYTSYGTIRIRFRMLMLPDPGDTVYRIDNAYFWAY
jgi:hypothetical protein